MQFFSERPEGEQDPEPTPRALPAWIQPPDGEIPVPLAVGRVLARVPSAALLLKRIDVYSSGCEFRIAVAARRDRSQPEERWFDILDVIQPMGHHRRRRSGPRVGVTLADGRTATGDEDRPSLERDERTGPIVTLRGGGGGGSDQNYEMTYRAWLWPVPPAGALTLHYAWPGLGIDEGGVELDGARVAEAARAAQQIWE